VIPDRSAAGGATLVHASDGSGNAYRDLFKACRGAGGGNFGIITNYFFSDLPDAPTEAVIGRLAFNWPDYAGADGRDKFKDLLQTYGQYWLDHDANADGWGLFALLQLTHSSALQFGLTLQFCDSNGTAQDLRIYEDFVNLFKAFEPADLTVYIPPATTPPRGRDAGHKALPNLPGDHRTIDWLYATQSYNGSGDNRRGKYKSSYMKQNFTDEEAYAIYDALIATPPQGADLSHSLVQVDSYGGRINRLSGPNNTSVAQRASVMKLQYQSYWTDPAADSAHLQWMSEFFAKVHEKSNGIPYDNGYSYEGCYINYPDVDMIDAATMAGIDWRELYYPGMVPFLNQVKTAIDPDNVFRHALSIWPHTTAP
jgi:FAD/FMN-containing dehydrogenase